MGMYFIFEKSVSVLYRQPKKATTKNEKKTNMSKEEAGDGEVGIYLYG